MYATGHYLDSSFMEAHDVKSPAEGCPKAPVDRETLQCSRPRRGKHAMAIAVTKSDASPEMGPERPVCPTCKVPMWLVRADNREANAERNEPYRYICMPCDDLTADHPRQSRLR